MIVAAYYGFVWYARVSVCPCVFGFPDDNLKNIDGFSPNLVCALILCRSGLGLLMGKFRQCLTELSACDMIMIMAGYYSLSFLYWQVKGIEGASPVVSLRYVEVPKVFVIDWMHSVLLGLVCVV